MNTITHDVWRRRGFTLLWDEPTLREFISPERAVPLRALFTMSHSWPEELPASDGQAVVVAGLDVCLDAFGDEEAAMAWLESRFRPLLRRFEEQYHSQAAAVFWVPGGMRRLELHAPSGEYRWKLQGTRGATELPLLRGMWGGAAEGAATILSPARAETAIGMYLQRLSG